MHTLLLLRKAVSNNRLTCGILSIPVDDASAKRDKCRESHIVMP